MKRAILLGCILSLLVTFNVAALTIQERVEAQQAIERVYYNHRIWPKENPGAKPPLETMLPEATLRAKVEDYLRKSDALDLYWQRPIMAQQLQAEMDRMARETKQPDVLRELFAVLNHDPQLIAECLARPILADRLIHDMYAGDERFHGALKRKVESELAITNTVEAMRALSGSYRESVWKKTDAGAERKPPENADGSIALNAQEWKDWMSRLQQYLPGLPAMRISRLQEDADHYYIIAILQKTRSSLRLATVEWEKQPFNKWWIEAADGTRMDFPTPASAYRLPDIQQSAVLASDTWTATDTGAPISRFHHTAVWTGAEMIVWGGECGGAGCSNTGGRYNPSTNTWAADGTSTMNAPNLAAHTAVWTGSEMIVWGGDDGNGYTNTGGRYNPSNNTWAPGGTSTAGAPTSRAYHTAIWTGTEMIVWGGYATGTSFNTGGRYNPSTDTWAAGGTSTTGAPAGRRFHTAVWTGTEMIVWGGYGVTFYMHTGGRYDPSTDTWAALGTSIVNAPSPRSNHTAVWTGSEMIIWGGYWYDVSEHYENTGGIYSPSTDTWTTGGTSTTNAPTGRDFHTAVWTGSEMIVWGGYDGTVYVNTGGRYNPSTNTWAAGGTSTTGATTSRAQHTAIWTGTEMIIWGGYVTGGTYFNTGGRYDPSTDNWAAGGTRTASAPTGRSHHSAIWTGAEMIVWGGDTMDTGGKYDPSTDTWVAISTTDAPAVRGSHTAVWTGSEMIVWGGYDGGNYVNSGGRYNPTSDTWAPSGTATTNAPTGRLRHTAVWTGANMIVWGGWDGGTALNSGARYDPSTDVWTATSTTGVPEARDQHTAIWTGSQMIVWGGRGATLLNTGGRYDPSSDSWTATSTTGAPSARESHTAIWTGTEMIVWGGWDSSGIANTGGRYNPSDAWAVGGTSIANVPSGRSAHTVVWTGTEMIVWGGNNDSNDVSTGGRYNPSNDTWTSTTTVEAPEPRTYHTAVWTGSRMIVWGGRNDAFVALNTGGIYAPTSSLFFDDFADGVLDWSYLKPAWNETGGNLVATPKRKAIAIADTVFPAGCRVCSVEAQMLTAGGVGNKLWLLGWYQDKNNTMELLIKEENDKVILRQRAGGRIVKKLAAAHITINPNMTYKFKIAFDGAQFDVSMDGAHLFTFVPAGVVPTGTVGFQVKNTVGKFDSINVQ